MSRSPCWECANDPSRRREAQIPDGIQFKSKVDLALDAIERAAADNVPGQLVLADAVYGRSAKFRDTVRRKTPLRWTGQTRNWTPVGPVTLNPHTHEAQALTRM
ncbi:transposase [Sorangium sp. So ce542]|uniref:transposase n=1 Tax=Sorangium sp. So ce542 TaxID=3133316 RepID=UPI003F6254D1